VSLPAVQVTQSPVEKFREYLASRPNPQRFTGQQRDLVEHVFARHSHFDADQLIRDLEAADLTVSRATVYRTLSKLVDAGMLVWQGRGRSKYFSLAGADVAQAVEALSEIGVRELPAPARELRIVLRRSAAGVELHIEQETSAAVDDDLLLMEERVSRLGGQLNRAAVQPGRSCIDVVLPA